MARSLGPTVPRWALGERLTRYREQAGASLAQAADQLGCGERKVRKIEAGEVGVSKGDLRLLVELYDVPDSERLELDELRGLAAQRGWWTRYGAIRSTYATFIGAEAAAVMIQAWEPYVVPGLLQTERYQCALAEAWNLPADEIVSSVQMRMERQKRVWEDDPPDAHFIVDESVLLRRMGDGDVMREQLARLLAPPERCVVQVLPLGQGAHRGSSGPLTIFHFADDLRAPVVYADSQSGSFYVDESEFENARRTMSSVMATAHNPSDSKAMIRARMEAIS